MHGSPASAYKTPPPSCPEFGRCLEVRRTQQRHSSDCVLPEFPLHASSPPVPGRYEGGVHPIREAGSMAPNVAYFYDEQIGNFCYGGGETAAVEERRC